MTRQFSISDLADEFGITTRTLRFYEEKGLLTPHRNGQTRVYSPADRTRLTLVLRGKRLGLSLRESAKIIDMYDPQTSNQQQLITLLKAIDERRQQCFEQLRELRTLLDDLDEVEARTRASHHQARLQHGDNIGGSHDSSLPHP